MEEETRSDADEESGGFNYERAAYITFCHCRCDLRPYRGRLKIVLRPFFEIWYIGCSHAW